jgi:hypothetical protein
MPFRYRYLRDRHVLLEAIFAEVTYDQLIAMKMQERDEGIGGLGMRSLVDMRQARFRVETGHVREFAGWIRTNLPGQLDIRTALLATAPVETGISLLYAAQIRPSKTVEVFTTLPSALKWLDLPEDVILENRDIVPFDLDTNGR